MPLLDFMRLSIDTDAWLRALVARNGPMTLDEIEYTYAARTGRRFLVLIEGLRPIDMLEFLRFESSLSRCGDGRWCVH